MRSWRRIALSGALLLLVGLLSLTLWARSAPRPSHLGIKKGRLAPCPPTPNCVATEQARPSQLMEGLPYSGSRQEAHRRLVAIIRNTPRTAIITEEPAYLAAEFRTPVIGFIDDVEFRFDDAAKLIHFRSASRLGRSDLGVNRARMEAISEAFVDMSRQAP